MSYIYLSKRSIGVSLVKDDEWIIKANSISL